jgi:hypothetical protein
MSSDAVIRTQQSNLSRMSDPYKAAESGEAKCDHSGSVKPRGIPPFPAPEPVGVTKADIYIRQTNALERIAAALERAYPEQPKRYAPSSAGSTRIGGASWPSDVEVSAWNSHQMYPVGESCRRFHPDEWCIPGQNHPGVPDGS